MFKKLIAVSLAAVMSLASASALAAEEYYGLAYSNINLNFDELFGNSYNTGDFSLKAIGLTIGEFSDDNDFLGFEFYIGTGIGETSDEGVLNPNSAANRLVANHDWELNYAGGASIRFGALHSDRTVNPYALLGYHWMRVGFLGGPSGNTITDRDGSQTDEVILVGTSYGIGVNIGQDDVHLGLKYVGYGFEYVEANSVQAELVWSF